MPACKRDCELVYGGAHCSTALPTSTCSTSLPLQYTTNEGALQAALAEAEAKVGDFSGRPDLVSLCACASVHAACSAIGNSLMRCRVRQA